MMSRRRAALLGGISALSAIAACRSTRVQAGPYAGTQAASDAPAFFRTRVGDAVVTALLDGGFVIPTASLPKFFPDAGSEGFAALERTTFPHSSGLAIPVGAYLVETGRNTVLIDAGGGPTYLPTTGRLSASLVASGRSPADVDTILLTHMHPEHALGVATPDGGRAFPNAELVVSDTEFRFWLDDANLGRVPQGPTFVEGARRAIAPYADRVRRFPDDRETEVVPGITTLPGPGHTPGNTSFRVASGSATLVVLGDVLHHPALQLATPRDRIGVDVDPALGVESRLRALDIVADGSSYVGGMHLPWPGFGRIRRAGEGFAYVPLPWQLA